MYYVYPNSQYTAIFIGGLSNNNNNTIGKITNNNSQLLYWSQYIGAQYTVEHPWKRELLVATVR